ncbi:minor capsid protein [Anaerococcus tetradius]|uniref:Phage protein F-like protein n=1 Tax=Anaerococcus tetradius TaxID=33036 RepID=A0A133KG97_9FIRM|nr:minor capsid protein [Anaerococcus tetradius]KWZ78583.1 phage protein F-like protein [Anaerococcus tetradius]
MKSRINRLEALQAEIMAHSAILAQEEEAEVGTFLEKGLTDTYYKGMYDEYLDKNPDVIDLMASNSVKLSSQSVNRVLTLPWSGDNYSSNIWRNSYFIAKKAQAMVAKNIIAGRSIDKLTNDFAKVYGNNYRANIRRLLRTETAFVKSQADVEVYKKLGVEEYEILATLDSRTSAICQEKDGKHYPIDDIRVGVNYPPFHPNCRTTTIKYNPDYEGRTRMAKDKDGKNVKVPLGMKYEEWKKWIEDKELGYIKSKEEILKISPNSSLEIINRVKNGEISLKSNRGHYGKHVVGTKQYENYLENRKNKGWGPQNRLIISEEKVQEIINKFYGKGIVYHGKNNNNKWFEEVNVGKTIGYYYLDGKESLTSKIRIYYGKKGTHIVPIRGDDFD